MRIERISPEQGRGKGWARVAMRECLVASGIYSINIIRPGYSDSFLGEHGWQISEARLPFQSESINGSEFTFLLPPAIVHYLDVNSNFEFKFLDVGGACLDKLVLRWSGISFRAIGGGVSPVQVIKEDVNPEALSVATPLPPAIDTWSPVEPLTLDGPLLSDWTSPPVSGSTPLESEVTSSPVERPSVFQEFRRVLCPQCGAEIFDNMKRCPFC